MRVLRSTFWKAPNDPTLAVVRECDVSSFEEAMAVPVNDALILHDIFEMHGEPTIEEALEEARQRIRTRDEAERAMALLYYFEVNELRKVTPGGTLTMDRPTPLDVDDLKTVLAAVALHPIYRDQTVETIASDGHMVTLSRAGISG